jgi:hypothetical protein
MVLKFEFNAVNDGTPEGDLISIFYLVANGYTTGDLGDFEAIRR